MTHQPHRHLDHQLFAERLLIIIGAALALLLFWRLSDLLVLVFGAVIVAVLLNAAAEPISRKTGLGKRSALAIVVLSIASAIAVLLVLFGAQINSQFSDLARNVPEGWKDLERIIGGFPFGDELVGPMREGIPSGANIVGRLGNLLLTLGNAIVDLILITIGAVFFAAQPHLYRNGFLKLFPVSWRSLLAEAVDDSGRAVGLWFRGQLISMAIVGVLTWLGLTLLGVPSAFALGWIAAFAEFIPYAGPIMAAIPGLLLALLLGPQKAMWVLLVYVAVQQLEGNIIQPLIQRKAVSLPPALTLFGMAAGGLLFGFLGLVLAAPAVVVAYVLLKRLYVVELLHTPTFVPGEETTGVDRATHPFLPQR